MLARMKTRTTGALTEISLTVPNELAESLCKAINGVLEFARLAPVESNKGHCADVDMIPVEEVIPQSSPGFRLRGLRTREGITQKELAATLGIRQHHVSEMESGKRTISVDMAKKIGEIYNISYKVFL